MKPKFFVPVWVTTSFLALLLVASSAVKADGITQKQADAILNELKQIRQLLEKQQPLLERRGVQTPAPDQNVKLQLVDTYAIGTTNAPVTLIEFTDYQCPFCSRFHTTTFPELKRKFIDTGKVRFISRDLPLEFHLNAFKAAQAARCAGDQGKYWELRDVLSSNPNNLGQDAILKYARDQQLDTKQFQTCLASDKYKAEIQKDVSDAQSVGISGTPTFLIGRTSAGGFEGIKVVGAQHLGAFEARITELLRSIGTP